MPLFTPKCIKELQAELKAAWVAFGVASSLPPDHQAKIGSTAQKDIPIAAEKAARMGKSMEARVILEKHVASPPNGAPPGYSWNKIMTAALSKVS